MAQRLRAAEETTDEQQAAAPAVVRPAPVVSNREMADKLTGPVGPADLAGLGGLGGNRAVVQLLGTGTAAPVVPPKQAQPTTAPAPAAAAAPAVPAVAPPPIDWIEALPAHIKGQIDNFSAGQEAAADKGDKRLTDARSRNRLKFMETMRWAMGGDDAVIQKHFQEIAPIDVGDHEQLWAHISTRERLAAVKADLEAQNIPMPQTDVGLGMRGDHLNVGNHSRTWFTHAVGFAVDWRAYQTPRITDERLIKLFDMVTGGRPDMKTSVEGDTRIDLEIKMGAGTATAAESKKLLDSVESEYNRLTAASEAFTTDLPQATLDRLREVEQARVAVPAARRRLAKLTARKKPKATKEETDAATKAVADAAEHYDKVRAAIVPDLPKLFEPWVKKIDDRIAVIDQEFAGARTDEDLLTSDYGLTELDKKVRQLQVAEAKLAKAGGAEPEKLAKLKDDITAAKEDVAARRKYREDKAAEIGGGTDKASLAKGRKKLQELIDEKFQLITLKSLKDGLTTNAHGFVFREKLATDDPAIDQLLGLMPENRGGFFTPDAEGGESQAEAGKFSGDHGYGMAFIKAMVSHGFEAGMAWRGGSDPMHFELAEGRKFLKSAGASPVQAGATLRESSKDKEKDTP